MIDKIGAVNSRYNTPDRDNFTQNPNFTGLGDMVIGAVQMCEKYPMLNVTALDLSTAIIPRTIIETKESNAHAGFEAFRREGSGLFVNCLIPSFIVIGVAKLLQRPLMGSFNKSNLVNTWANGDSINKIHHFYANAEGSTAQEKVANTFKNMFNNISGADGSETKDFAEIFKNNKKFNQAVQDLTEAVTSEKFDKKAVKKAYETLVNETHISENIKFKNNKGYFTNNFKSLCEDTVKMLRGVVKENITDKDQLANYFKRAKKLVNWKSIGGLGIIIPLAISMQPINRWITRKTSGQKGAPIYKDFGKDNDSKVLTPKEKRELLVQKFISIGSMVGVAGLSMFMDKPTLKMFQFKGLFPTMDQARIISTATFASRMASAEDKNELREATVRDIATFASFYFLGDYVAKGIATLFEKYGKNVRLLNILEKPKEGANALQKLWHWAKHTSIKSTDELMSVKDKKLRTICQIGNLVFSLISLGVLIPLYTRMKTNKKHAEELTRNNAGEHLNSDTKLDNFSKSLLRDKTAFSAFTHS